MSGGTNLKACLLMSILLLGMGCTAAAGRTIYVDDDGPAEFDNIQAAIDDSNDGDTIIVRDGTYTGGGNRDIDFLGKAITLRSENGPENCVIDCNGTEAEPHRGFYFHNGEDANSVLDGFTIRNGYEVSGGGIRCYIASPTIRNCIITNNKADGGAGGGIYCNHCYGVTITNCVITENVAALGGGIYCSFGMMDIAFNDVIVTNCTFSANSAEYGGGAIRIGEGSNPSMVNCILWGDTAPHGPEITMYCLDWGSQLSISFSNIQGGEAAVYDKCFLRWGPGNIDADPCFADANNGDFHLKSEAARWDPDSQIWVQDDVNSPCIDTGDPNSDWTEELWPHGKRINMGTYGGTPQASMSLSSAGNVADLNNDDSVDYKDLMRLTDDWLCQQVLLSGDLDRNGIVNLGDFTIFADNWRWEQ